MNPLDEFNTLNTRRHFLNTGARGLGALAAASLMNPGLLQGGLAPSTAGGGTWPTPLRTKSQAGNLSFLLWWPITHRHV